MYICRYELTNIKVDNAKYKHMLYRHLSIHVHTLRSQGLVLQLQDLRKMLS